MTMDRPARLEGRLPALFEELAPARTPDYLEAAIEDASSRPQRPAWTFPERWLPMDLLARPAWAPAVPWRQIGLLAVLAALLAALFAFYVGAQQRTPAPYGLAANGLVAYTDGGDIYARDSTAGPPRLLVGGAPHDYAMGFSRQGNLLLFNRVPPAPAGSSVWVVRPDGGGLRQLDGEYRLISGVDWSPQGDRVAITHSPNGRNVLTIVPVDGSPATTLRLDIEATEVLWRPPNGNQLSVRGKDAEGWGLFLLRPDGSGLSRVDLNSERMFQTDYDVRLHRWSNDGGRVIFDHMHTVAAGNTSGLRIHVAEIGPAGEVLSDQRYEIEPTADDELYPTWLPGEDRIVYQRRLGNEDVGITDSVHVVSLEPRTAPIDLGIRSTAGEGLRYEISPDGHQLITFLHGEKETYVTNLQTYETTAAPFTGEDGPVWQRRAIP